MRYEETNDIATVVVEATDERNLVMDRLSLLSGGPKPTIVVLPEDAVLRRPGDLRELRQVTEHLERELILVIEGNERLRLWARRQGFTTFSAVAPCVRALAQQRTLHATKPLYEAFSTRPEYKVSGGEPATERTRSSNRSFQMHTPGETYASAVTYSDSRRTFGYSRMSDPILESQSSRATGSLMTIERPPVTETRVAVGSSMMLSPTLHVTEPMDLAFIGEIGDSEYIDTYAHYPPMGQDHAFSLVQGDVREIRSMALVSEQAYSVQAQPRDVLMLWLLALLILGLVGGISFSYLL